jgi:large-conductance mechanosensitive channel
MPKVLFGATEGGQLVGVIIGAVMDFPIIWAVCFVVTFLLVQPVEKIARKLCNDPAPQM